MLHSARADGVVVGSGILHLILAVEYCDVSGDGLDVPPFCGMWLHCDLLELPDLHDVSCDSALGAWIEIWKL